jgi:hypothetical protein
MLLSHNYNILFITIVIFACQCNYNNNKINDIYVKKNIASIQDALSKNNAIELDSIGTESLFNYQIQSKLPIGKKIGLRVSFMLWYDFLGYDISAMDSFYILTCPPDLNRRFTITILLQQTDIDKLEKAPNGYMIVEIIRQEFLEVVSTLYTKEKTTEYPEKQLNIIAKIVDYIELINEK